MTFRRLASAVVVVLALGAWSLMAAWLLTGDVEDLGCPPFLLVGGGALITLAAGLSVAFSAATGRAPARRLRESMERVADTVDLRPI